MNCFTEAVWDVLIDNNELLAELTAIMEKEHKPFLNSEQAFEANTNLIKQHIEDRFTKWLQWLPTLPIDQIGCALAEEAFAFVEWDKIAKLVQKPIAPVSSLQGEKDGKLHHR